jgi:hypothetical protein
VSCLVFVKVTALVKGYPTLTRNRTASSCEVSDREKEKFPDGKSCVLHKHVLETWYLVMKCQF